MNDFEEAVSRYVTLRDVYDGWSVRVLEDGSMINRWDPKKDPRRWAATQNYISQMEAARDSAR